MVQGKHILSEDEDECQQPVNKSQRTADIEETQLIRPSQGHEGHSDKRPKRANRGKGGVVAQLLKVGEQITQTRKKKPITTKLGNNMPKEVTPNIMAPPVVKTRVRKGMESIPTIIPLHKEDPPLGSGAPQPIAQNHIDNTDTRFGFRAGPRGTRTSHSKALGSHIPIPATHVPASIVHRRPVLLPKFQLHADHQSQVEQKKLKQATSRVAADRALSEVIPDSEEEHQSSHSDSEQSQKDKSDSCSGEEDGGSKGSVRSDSGGDRENPFDEGQDDMIEMQQDPNANDAYNENQNMDIDEESPGEEDEHYARELHRHSIPADAPQSPDAYSVLALHHATNRKIRAPDPIDLDHPNSHRNPITNPSRHRRNHSHGTKGANNEDVDDEDVNNEDASDEDADDGDDPILPPSKTRMPRNSQNITDKSPTRTQLGFYSDSPVWMNLIEFAKNHHRLHLYTSKNSFPERAAATLGIALKSIMQGILIHESDPDSEPLDDYYFDKHALSILIFEDGASYRGKMKTMGREILLAHFQDVLRPRLDKKTFKNKSVRLAKIVSDVEALLHHGSFLRGGLDKNGKTKNFGHAVLADLCQQFYYGNKDSLGILFPNHFCSELPRPCLAMACACLVNCLREYVTGIHISISFEGKVFGPVQTSMLDLIHELDNHTYHSSRITQLLEDIAWAGGVQSGKDSNKIDLGFCNVLD